MFSLKHPHLLICNVDKQFTKQNIINIINNLQIGKIHDISVLSGSSKHTNNIVVFMNKWNSSLYANECKDVLYYKQYFNVYYNTNEFWKVGLYDPTKNAKSINIVRSTRPSVQIDERNQSLIIDYGDCYKIKPPRRRVSRKPK